jgi:hypothetical protein
MRTCDGVSAAVWEPAVPAPADPAVAPDDLRHSGSTRCATGPRLSKIVRRGTELGVRGDACIARASEAKDPARSPSIAYAPGC